MKRMNHKYVPAIAAFLILGVLLSATPLAYGVNVLTFGPKLEVVTIPQDNQKLAKGIILLGIDPAQDPTVPPVNAEGSPFILRTDLLSQHKIIVTYNGATLKWNVQDPGPAIACNVLEKDKIAVQPDPKTGDGQQGSWENLMTALVDVSDKFVCKVRWKSPSTGVYESVGVLDVYYVGPLPAPAVSSTDPAKATKGVTPLAVAPWIADNILVVEAFFTVGRTVVFGSDIQDICVLGWPIFADAINYAEPAIGFAIDKPATIFWDPVAMIYRGDEHWVFQNAMGTYVSCEELALAQRNFLGLTIPPGQDPLA
jgi:hypothetical protein